MASLAHAVVASPRDERRGDQCAERAGVGELEPVRAEQRGDRDARLRIVERVQQVPPAERREDVGTVRACERLARRGQELVVQRAGGLGRRHGSSSSCLAIVSSCICCEPP